MRLSIKASLLLLCAFLLLQSSTMIVLRSVLLPGLEDVEQRRAQMDAERVADAVHDRVRQLDEATHEWSSWDDLYAYAAGRLPVFETTTLAPGSVAVSGFDILAILDPHGRPRFFRDGVWPTRAMPANLAGFASVWADQSSGCGLLQVEQRPLMVCVRPILRTDNKGPLHGRVLTGIYLHPGRIAELARQLDLTPLTKPVAGLDWIALERGGERFALERTSETRLNVLVQIDDPQGQPVLTLQFSHPRDYLKYSTDAFRKASLLSVPVLLFILALLYLVFDRTILRRVLRLEQAVQSARSQRNWHHPLPLLHRGDELGRLAQGIQQLFLEIERNIHELQTLSLIDSLTEIPNRRAFDLRLEEEWARHMRQRRPLALIFIDIDEFKRYNDCYGHQSGDAVLKTVASLMVNSLYRETDMLARYGGEEFAVILPNTTAAAAVEVADRLRLSLQQAAIKHENSRITTVLTLSAGVSSLLPSAQLGSQDLLESADAALYRAKSGGRNRVALDSTVGGH